MNIRRFPELLAGIIVLIFFGVAYYLRVVLPYDQVFGSDWIKFSSNDAYYQMRLVDNLVRNFPHLNRFDPYIIYPGGDTVGGFRFFNWLLAGIIWLIGLGSPGQHTVDVIGAYIPAVLGALTVIPVYFIGRELFGKWAGVIAAGLIAIMPGESIGRSILAWAENDAINTLFTTTVILFLVLAIKTAGQKQLTFRHLNSRDWKVAVIPAIYSLLAGFFLALYMLTWAGSLLFVFLIAVYLIVQFTIDHLRRRSTDYLCLVGVPLFLIALIIFTPLSPVLFYQVSLIFAVLIILALSGLSRLLTFRGMKPGYYPLGWIGLAVVGLAAFYVVAPSLLKVMLLQFSVFTPSGPSLTTLEMQPLLAPQGEFTLTIAWGNFTTGFFFSLIALGILIYQLIKQNNAERVFIVVWSLVTLAAVLGQRRFAIYYAVNVALLTGYLAWQVFWFAGLRRLMTGTEQTTG